MTATCQTSRSFSGAECDEAAVADVTVGCVHEHMFDTWMCGEHLREACARRALCCICLDSDRSHRCTVRVLTTKPVTA